MWRTGDIPSDNSLKGNDLCLPNEHRTAVQLALVFAHLIRHLVDVGGDEVIRDDVFEFVEPEKRDTGQEFTLVGYALYVRFPRINTDRICGGKRMRTLFKMTSYAEILSLATKRR